MKKSNFFSTTEKQKQQQQKQQQKENEKMSPFKTSFNHIQKFRGCFRFYFQFVASTKAATRGDLWKNAFFKILQNLLQYISVGVSFFDKVAGLSPM